MQKKGYPSDFLIQRYFEAYQEEGEAGIRRVMREQRDKGKYVEDLIRKTIQKDDDCSSAS